MAWAYRMKWGPTCFAQQAGTVAGGYGTARFRASDQQSADEE